MNRIENPTPLGVAHHEVRFERNTITGKWRATCPCGWLIFGDREEVQSRAAVHDIEWVEADPKAPDEQVLDSN